LESLMALCRVDMDIIWNCTSGGGPSIMETMTNGKGQ